MVDIFIFILFFFFATHALLPWHLHFFCWLRMSSSSRSPQKETFFASLLRGANYLGFHIPRNSRGWAGWIFLSNVISHCRFRMKFLFANPTSLICFSSLPIPSDNSHIECLRQGWQVAQEDFVAPRSTLLHHFTNSCFSLSFILLFFFWIASFFSISIPPSNINSHSCPPS